MEHVKGLINRVRRDSQSKVYSKNTGVSNQQICDFLNEALHEIVSNISLQNSVFFQKMVTVPLGGDGTYSLRGQMFLDSKIIAVQAVGDSYLPNGNIPYRDIRESTTSVSTSYYVQNGEIVLSTNLNLPSAIQIIYEDKLPEYALPFGKITAGAGSGGDVTAVTVSYLNGFDDTDINDIGDLYFNAIDKDGTILMRNIPYISVASGVFTMNPYSYSIGETINVDDYVTLGKYTTSHIPISKEHKNFIVAHAVWRVRGHQGASFETQTHCKKVRDEFLKTLQDAHADPVKDYNTINVVDRDLLQV